jgi:hypothetical protein
MSGRFDEASPQDAKYPELDGACNSVKTTAATADKSDLRTFASEQECGRLADP